MSTTLATPAKAAGRSSVKHRIPLLLTTIIAALLFAFRGSWAGLDLEQASRVAVIVAGISYWTVVQRAPRGAWSLGPLFLLLVLLFHFGDLLIIATGASFAPNDQAYVNLWLYGPYVSTAIYLSMLAAVAFALVYGLCNNPNADDTDASDMTQATHPLEERRGKAFAAAGFVLVAGGVLVYFARAFSVAPGILFSADYQEFNRLLGGDRILSLAGLSIIIGLVLAAAAPKCAARRGALIAFAIFAVVLLTLGVRTIVLFPAAAGAVAMAWRHRMPSGAKTLAVVLAALALIGLVRGVRTEGGAALNLQQVNPISALAEMGGTLRPVVETVRWHETYNEPRKHGISYAAPVLRLKERVMGEASPELDDRLPGTLMQTRVAGGQFGYSAVAEPYLNFGPLGLVSVFALFGLLAARIDRRRRGGVAAAAFAGVAMAAIGLTVRNTFISFPSTMIAGCLAIAVVSFYARTRMNLLSGHRAHRM